jgi:hypothetical protein
MTKCPSYDYVGKFIGSLTSLAALRAQCILTLVYKKLFAPIKLKQKITEASVKSYLLFQFE